MNAFMGDYTAEEQVKIIASSIVDLSQKKDGLASYVQEVSGFASKGDFVKALSKLIEESAALFAHAEGDDVIGPFNCIALLLCSKLTGADLETLVLALAEKIVTGKETAIHTLVRTQILSNLFNNLDGSSPLRRRVFEKIVSFSQSAGLLVELVEQDVQIDTWLEEWGATIDESRALYRLIMDGLEESTLKQKFLIKFLKTYNGEGSDLVSVRDIATTVITNAIRDDMCFQMDDLRSLKAVTQLDGEDVYKLYTIFVQGNVKEFNTFAASKQAVLAKHNLDAEACKLKMMRLTLVSLCAGRTEVSYDDIIAELEVEAKELEAFVINAIKVKVIEACMDQLRRVLVVSRVMTRVFEHKDWEVIERKLANLRTGLLEVIMVGAGRKQQIRMSNGKANN